MQNNFRSKTQLFFIFLFIMPFGLLAQTQNFDQYGGRLDIHLDEGNGFFRLGEINGKHFLVTPEGNAFRSIGINHTHMIPTNNYDEIISNLKAMGFNSGDYQGPAWMWNRFPYTKGVNLLSTSIWLPEDKFMFEDVFDPGYLSKLESNIKSIVAPQAENKMLICYFLTDVPAWNIEKYGQGWIEFFKSLNENTPGKKEWNKWKADNPNAKEEDFIPVIAKQVYSQGTSLIRKYDKNHLIFSDRFHEYNFPEKVALEVLPFVDGIATQPNNFLDLKYFDYLYDKFKKPVFIADHVTSYATDEYANTMGQVASNANDYLDFYMKSVYDVMTLSYVVGYNKCQYMDEVNGTQLKQGLYRTNGEAYEYLDGLKEAHNKALDEAYLIPVEQTENNLQDWGKYEGIKNEAIERIEKYRKGDVHLKVILPNQKVALNAKVRVKLKRHDFKWGAVIRESFFTSPNSEVYKEMFLKYFNASGFGIELKPKWRGTDFEKTTENIGMPWLLKNDIYVRGHTLAWEGLSYMRPEDQAIYNDTNLSDKEKGEKMLESCGKHFYHAIPKWDVKCWDVTNESIGNNIINDLLPDLNSHVHWFKLADSILKTNGKEDVVLYQNDYQIISAITPWALNYKKTGYKALGRPAIYREILDEQIALGAPIEGIGFQSRLKQGLITPDTIYKRLCDFDRYNLPFQATEFEIRDDANKYIYTDEERRLLTEYMMVMYFSHPKVNGFWHWTFADVRSSDNWDYSLFNYDGTPKINGQKWIELMEGFFNTDEIVTTSTIGEVDVRGYYGSYEIEAEIEGKTLVGEFEIDSTDTNTTIIVNLEGDITSSNPYIKKKVDEKVQIRQNRNELYIDVRVNLEMLQAKQLEIELFDLQGRAFYKEQFSNRTTIIPAGRINKKGFSIAIVRDVKTGERLATEKIVLM